MIDVIDGPTQISPGQMRLPQLFSVERILASRGFQIESEGIATDTLLTKNPWTFEERNLMFEAFDNVIFRNELLTAIENPSLSSFHPEVSHLLALPTFERDRNKFSTTFEWYVGELLVRKFQAFSSSFGVNVEDIVRNTDNGTAGDFDVLTVLGDMNLLYLECKTGKCSQKSINNTIERSLALHSLASVIFMGTGTDENALRQQLRGLNHPLRSGRTSFVKFNIKNIPDSIVYEWYNCYFVPANETSGTVEIKLRAVLRLLAAHRTTILSLIRPDASEYNSVGYDYSEINF